MSSFLSHSLILAGSPCSGKSTMAQLLAAEFALPYYKVDDFEQDHMQRSRIDRHPVMARYTAMNCNDIWMRPPALQTAELFDFYGERWEMIVEDLQPYDPERPLLLEGAALLPDLLNETDARRENILFMVPTLEFQVQHYGKRPWIKDILQTCADPQQAFDNWMMRDHLFGQEILRQAEAFGYRSIVVDGRQSIAGQFAAIKDLFNLV